MSRRIDITGKRFGKLLVLGPTDIRRWKSVVWLCVCDCGRQTYVNGPDLRRGNTRSCGCLRGYVHGNPISVFGSVAIVDTFAGAEILIDAVSVLGVCKYVWGVTVAGYASTTVGGSAVLMHRYLLGSPESQVDHRNGDRLDNRMCNLRLATRVENARNVTVVRAASGFKGVYPGKPGKWCAQIRSGGKTRCLGTFSSKIDAARAYNHKALELFGEFASLNVIPE